MPRFFQHVEPGEKQGKVTRLKYIDDVSDDELILYCFEDGTRCNKDFVGSVNETEESIKKFVMVELTGPTNQWSFMKKEVHADVSKMIRDEVTGQVYEAVGPDVKLSGGPGAQNRSIESVTKDDIRIEITPPRKQNRFVQEEDDQYCLSVNPQLENGSTNTVVQTPVVKQQKPVSAPQKVIKEIDETTTEQKENIAVETVTLGTIAPVNGLSSRYIIKQNTVSDLCIDLGQVKSDESIGKLTFRNGDKEYSYSVSELIAMFNTTERVNTGSTTSNIQEREVFEGESDLIKNMIDKSKKKACTIAMNLTLNLPPKEIYDTIKSVYEEGLADEFVKSVTIRIPKTELYNSLSNGLNAYYSGTMAKKTTVKKEED